MKIRLMRISWLAYLRAGLNIRYLRPTLLASQVYLCFFVPVFLYTPEKQKTFDLD